MIRKTTRDRTKRPQIRSRTTTLGNQRG